MASIYDGVQCEIQGCERDAKIKNMCLRCYSASHYWHKREPEQILARIQKLILFTHRMEYFAPKLRTRKKRR